MNIRMGEGGTHVGCEEWVQGGSQRSLHLRFVGRSNVPTTAGLGSAPSARGTRVLPSSGAS